MKHSNMKPEKLKEVVLLVTLPLFRGSKSTVQLQYVGDRDLAAV